MTMAGCHIEIVQPGQQEAGLPGATDLPDMPRCAAIIAVDPAVKIAGLQAATTSFAEAGAISVRVGNPLSSPLTLERILFQIDQGAGVDDADMDVETHLARFLEERRGAYNRVVLVAEQAETLDATALLSLQRLASAPGALQVLFVGAPAFWALLDDTPLTPLRRALMTGREVEPAVVAPTASFVSAIVAPVPPAYDALLEHPADITSGSPPAVAARSVRRWWVAGAVGLAASFALGAAVVLAPGGLFYYATPQRDPLTHLNVEAGPGQPPTALQPNSPTSPAVSALAAPSLSQMATSARPSTLQVLPAASPAAHAGTQQTHLRFDPTQSLDAPGQETDVLTDAQWGTKSARSEQSQSWQPSDAASPAVTPPAEGRIVIHYRGGSEAGEAEADRLAVVAAPLAAQVQTRMVADTPSAPVVRFFHPEDEARAQQLAGALSIAGQRWEVRNFGDFRPRPSLGTIEVWTPVR